jgi:hypothetical protein
MPSFSADAFQESRPIQERGHARSPQSSEPRKGRGEGGTTPFFPSSSPPQGFEDIATLRQACSSECRGAQGAFKDSMIHGRSAIHITYRDSLRPSSMREPRDPSLKVVHRASDARHTHTRSMNFREVDVGPSDLRWVHRKGRRTRRTREALVVVESDSLMILPQVHLRKPCYDFYFL